MKQRKWVGFRHQFSWSRHSARHCKSYQNKGNKKFTPWDLRNPPILTVILNTENVRSNLSSALIQKEYLNLRLLSSLTTFLGKLHSFVSLADTSRSISDYVQKYTLSTVFHSSTVSFIHLRNYWGAVIP